jgi:hypothetical protein
LVKAADVIVRAKAVEYVGTATVSKVTGQIDSPVRFEVLESVRGPSAKELVFPGG